MKRLALFSLWTVLFLAMFLGIDQLLMRVETGLPVMAEVRTFYVDFRTRLLHLGKQPTQKAQPGGKKASPPAAPARKEKSTPSKQATASTAKGPRYLYADAQGELRFADSIDEVPAAYRKDAQALER